MGTGDENKRYYRKRVDLFRLLKKIKLWPARSGALHGIKSIIERGGYAEITTHCNNLIIVRNSKHSRAARWLRNKWFHAACHDCQLPKWKLVKYSQSFFSQHYGSDLVSKQSINLLEGNQNEG